MLQHHQSKAIRNLTITFLIALGFLLFLIGCTQLYKFIGFTDEQIQNQVTQDQAARKEIIEEIRLTTTELITTAIAGVGAIASGFLAKWLGTERKITKALITGIETSDNSSTKEAIKAKALSAGVETKLNARVKALT